MRKPNISYQPNLTLISVILLISSFTAIAQGSFPKSKISAKTNHYFTSNDGNEFITNSALLYKDINTKEDSIAAFNISEVILNRRLKSHCQKQSVALSGVTARVVNDSLRIVFTNKSNYSQNGLRKMLEVIIIEDGTLASLYHSDEKYRILEYTDGSTKVVPALKSKIEKVKIKLNKSQFRKGDIIKGDIYLEADYVTSNRSSRQVSEILKGSFRCVVE